ncbi:MAG TPA: DUF4139 domain-containing protein [Terracidiphilus sp.]|nr:DUF4139 domain-containing protein [Terracidiphilus sp.]
MRLLLTCCCCVFSALALTAQTTKPTSRTKTAAPAAISAAPPVVKDLPVRKVVLYKNGVGYFEHAGTVSGNQRVTIDFTSPQLNDVLQSLTVLDEGGGRIAGVNYNSTTPLAEQLKTLSLGMSDDPNSTDLFQSLRGQRVEVTGAPGGTIEGRLMSIEARTEKAGGNDGDTTVNKFYLTVVAGSGAVRVIELTPALSVRPVDAGLQGQLDRYLELLSTAHATGLRHLTLDALGQGQRELRVSYISEVPVWKSTYRIVFPREANGNATVQGWAVVDNTVGADWDNVQLALVAGAPQSFIQPLSQPLYTRRPEIPIAVAAETTPQTHEAAEREFDRLDLSAKLMAAPPMPVGGPMAQKDVNGRLKGAYANAAETVTVSGTNMATLGGIGSGSGGGYGGGVYRVSDAMQQSDVSANAFDDFFEYALSAPVTIHKNESAMVPILQQDLPAEHVTLWSQSEARPLRAVWLENKSSVTLDSGSFSIFENGEFAGEGLLDPIHPGEKRLLSYATDQAVKVRRGGFTDKRTLHHIAMHDGVMIETTSERSESTYTVTNGANDARTVVVEHPRQDRSELTTETKPAETTANAYRFKVAVEPHQSSELKVGEKTDLAETVVINPDLDRTAFLVAVSKYTPELETKLRPLVDAETALADVNRKLAENQQKQKTLGDDEARIRENVTALKGNEAAKRFVDELNRAEDDLDTSRKDQASLQQQRESARAHLSEVIAKLSFDTDLDVVTQGN